MGSSLNCEGLGHFATAPKSRRIMRAKKVCVQKMVPLRTERIARERSDASGRSRQFCLNSKNCAEPTLDFLLRDDGPARRPPVDPRPERSTSPAAGATATSSPLPRADCQTSTWAVTPRSRSKAALAFK
jgi:hypothetical protein